MIDDEPGGLLRKIVTVLEAAFIPHMVVGSFASTAHGEPRTTRDLDLVIDPPPDQLNELLAALDAEHYHVDADVAGGALRCRSMLNIIEIATGWKLDLVIRKARPFSWATRTRPRLVAKLDGTFSWAGRDGCMTDSNEVRKRCRELRNDAVGYCAGVAGQPGDITGAQQVLHGVKRRAQRPQRRPRGRVVAAGLCGAATRDRSADYSFMLAT